MVTAFALGGKIALGHCFFVTHAARVAGVNGGGRICLIWYPTAAMKKITMPG